MMDGGRGQVNIALEVLDQLGLKIPVCGMVKDDHHNTRGLYSIMLRYRLIRTVKDLNLLREFRTKHTDLR